MALISYINHVDRAGVTFTPGTEELGFEATRLQDPQVNRIWRTQAATENITVDFGADRDVDIVAVVFMRKNGLEALDAAAEFASTDTIRHRLYDSGASLLWDSTAGNSGVTKELGYHVLDVKALNSGTVTGVRSWRIDFTGTSRAGDGFFDVGRLWAGESFQPTVNYTFRAEFGWEDASLIVSTKRSLADYVDRGALRRSWQVTFNSLKAADEAEFDNMERIVGQQSQILFSKEDTGSLHDETILCRQVRASGITRLNVDRYEKSFRFIESL